MDPELFMECEEEELEPWQQVDDSVEEDDVEFMDHYGEPVEDSSSSPPTSVTPPPRSPPSIPVPAASAPLQFLSSSSAIPPPPPPPPPSITATSSTLCLTATSKPAASASPLRAQAPPLILTQTAGGTFLLPAAPGTGSTQPIFLTTQGFQMPTVMNPGAPLVLNLQPGQTMQPLTLIQSPSLGQLIRPGVGMSTVLSQKQPAPGPSHPGSTFTSMQLPTTLTIRTSAPGSVNLQVSQVSGGSSQKLASSPDQNSASTNGVMKATNLSTTKAPGQTLSVVTTATASEPPRVVMSVEEFYYGRFSGDISLRKPPPPGMNIFSFTCYICSFRAENNLRLMQHVLYHSELVVDGKDRHCCHYCYRQFSSPGQLKDHQDEVHGSTQSSCLCRICEWAFDNEPAFLNHMKSNHKPGEMPYVCQVCSFRSSFYSDVLQHFATFHRETLFLLCVFCLKVMKNPTNYQQHLYRHKLSQAFHCNRCRLQFIFLKDKMQHRVENHRSFRRPPQLEGLPPGSKVTIRTYGKLKPQMAPNSIFQPNRIKTEHPKFPIQKNPTLIKAPKSPTKRGPGRRGHSRLSSGDQLVCLECGTDASDLTAHYPTYVHCLLCPYSSCCSRAYAAHMIHHHVRGSKDKVLPVQKAPPPCAFVLRCSGCRFQPRSADQMAEHLLRNPKHNSAICCGRKYTEPDIQLCHSAEQQSSEEPDQNQDLPEPSWKLAHNWKLADESSKTPTLAFTNPCGPNHYLSKNCDAIDFFNLIFPSGLIELITKETNAHAKTCRVLGFCPPDWVPVTTHEVKGFIGLVILIGIHNLPDLSHYWSFNHFDNSYTFYRAMTIKRFKQIAAHIRMGSFINEIHGSGLSSDPLHVFRPMLSILGCAMWEAYQPNCCLTIDRALLPSLEEESCSTQGNPKSQPQVWLLCDSKSGYCHRFLIQVGEKSGQDLGFSVVLELVKDLNNKHHQLFLANSLTSIPLMQKLLDQNIYACSSFPPPNPILPRELWEEGELEKPGDFLQRQCGPLLATRWRDTKEMGCLSTNAAAGEPDAVWRRSPTKAGGLVTIDRPMAFRLLQENMRGVDICKQLLACNPLGGIPQDRHWRNLFWFLVNLSIVNAFIILRESRKDNPPAWVQDGLFSQVNFRKRLGNQLAKCAQKYFETLEVSSSRGGKSDASEEPIKQRHRMSKISSISKRCKNCNLKNMRHESVYGCIVCEANLCKQPSCFWEYHGLSPLNKGPTKIGFLKDRVSGEINMDEVKDNVDETMGPVEDLDFSDDDKLDDVKDDEEINAQKKDLTSEGSESQLPSETNRHAQPVARLSASAQSDGSLSVRQLRIILFALCEGLRQASRVFSTDTQLIRSWLKEARKRLKQTEQEMLHADGSERMVAWVLSMREQQLPITESNLFNKASILKKKRAFSDSFRISYDWAVSFLLQHRLGVCRVGRASSLACSRPPFMEFRVQSFRDFTQKVFRVHRLTERSVAAMDELSLFVDFRLAQDKSRCSEALELSGATPVITVYLTVLADGTMLPALVLPTKQIQKKVVPHFFLLEASPDVLTVEESLDLWYTKVWLQHRSGPTQPGKSMLILDRHREHLGDRFLTSLSASQSLPAVIPAGCSFCLQPLEVCLKPVLQRLLLSRWSAFTARNPPELEETPTHKLQETVTQLLVDWLLEALTHLHKLPELWRSSFHVTGLLQASSEGRTRQKPEDSQSELLRTLTEILLEPEATEADSPELQELEDKDDEWDKRETSEENLESRDDRMKVEESEKETEDKDGEDIEEVRPEDRETAGEQKVTDWKDTSDTKDEDREEKRKTVEEDWVEQGKKTETVKDNTKDKRPKDREKAGEGTDRVRKDSRNKETETRDEKETQTLEEDSEEEGKEREEDMKDVSKERRETRIVIGEEVGDEWKITVKNRSEGARSEGKEQS